MTVLIWGSQQPAVLEAAILSAEPNQVYAGISLGCGVSTAGWYQESHE